ncbi:hypothetical protein C8J27_1131 [Rhodobacter aestuarii]|uniref:Uncharacterized protein n=1 Tax=Rhodobacter aestuarii TaxID=453582 RepID=A0A1N7QBI0_9RHOB|nr:hypothetical protein C8J27_1131 [Rhodobacter aestuarii]SIT19907.1 hypothetical protein SAMN05421580_1151 [Rhodobacter aestuarii]
MGKDRCRRRPDAFETSDRGLGLFAEQDFSDEKAVYATPCAGVLTGLVADLGARHNWFEFGAQASTGGGSGKGMGVSSCGLLPRWCP